MKGAIQLLNYCLRLLLSLMLTGAFFLATPTYASTLASPMDTLSNPHIASVSDHTIAFTTPDSNETVKRISFQFTTVSGGSTEPAGLNLVPATLGTVSASLGSGWTLNSSSASGGTLYIELATATVLASPSSHSVTLQSITNNTSLETCQTGTHTLADTCNVSIKLYSDDGTTLVDSGEAPYMVIQDPSMKLEISPVSSGTTTNGITTNATSTGSLLAYGTIGQSTVKYLAQTLKVTTNAPHGYTVYAYLTSAVTGVYHGELISPFGGTNATWTTPQPWENPTGARTGSNAGWLAANTTDTRVTPGWSGTTTSLFGPISTTKHAVAHSDGPDLSGTTVTVSYALGVNGVQSADTYTGNILYDVEATY